jgi:hypothetical protein
MLADAAGGNCGRAARTRPGLFLAGTFFFFIGSLTRTTVANTFVLMSVSLFPRRSPAACSCAKRRRCRTWIAMTVAFAGIVVMFADSLDGRLSGNLLRLASSCCFAGQVTVRSTTRVDMLPRWSRSRFAHRRAVVRPRVRRNASRSPILALIMRNSGPVACSRPPRRLAGDRARLRAAGADPRPAWCGR